MTALEDLRKKPYDELVDWEKRILKAALLSEKTAEEALIEWNRLVAVEKAAKKLLDAATEVTRMDNSQLMNEKKRYDWRWIRDTSEALEKAMRGE